MSKMSFSGQKVGGKNLRMAFKRSGVRFSYAPQKEIVNQWISNLFLILRIKSYTVLGLSFHIIVVLLRK